MDIWALASYSNIIKEQEEVLKQLHYFTPSITELKHRTVKAVQEMLAILSS